MRPIRRRMRPWAAEIAVCVYVCVCVCVTYRHWVDFRAKHGWADEELVDAYGDPVQRTDGGRRVKGKKGQMPPHVKAR